MSDHYGKCDKCGRLSGINNKLICFECRCCPKKSKKIEKLQAQLEKLTKCECFNKEVRLTYDLDKCQGCENKAALDKGEE